MWYPRITTTYALFRLTFRNFRCECKQVKEDGSCQCVVSVIIALCNDSSCDNDTKHNNNNNYYYYYDYKCNYYTRHFAGDSVQCRSVVLLVRSEAKPMRR